MVRERKVALVILDEKHNIVSNVLATGERFAWSEEYDEDVSRMHNLDVACFAKSQLVSRADELIDFIKRDYDEELKVEVKPASLEVRK